MPRVQIIMRRLSAILFLLFPFGCAPLPVVTLGSPHEIPWKRFRVTLEVTRRPSGFQVAMNYWAPGMATAGLFDPFDGISLILKDGKVVEPDTSAPQIPSYSGGCASAGSQKIVMTYSIPNDAIPSHLELRCGLGTLRCTVVSEWDLDERDPDRY